MKQLMLLLLCSCLSGVATAAPASTHVLLKYNMGNQITRSGLTVLSNGLIMRDQTSMGRVTYLEDQQLSDAELEDFKVLVDEAAKAESIRVGNIVALHGGVYGESQLFTSDGSSALLYVVVGDQNPDTKTMVCQSGAAADSLRSFIQARVRDQMPLRQIPCQ